MGDGNMSCETLVPMKKTSNFLPYPNDHVPDNMLRKAEKELRETPELKQKALKELKDMLQECPKTKKIHFEEDFLIHYLRASKYTTEKSFKHLQNYVDIRTKYNYLFQGVPDEYISEKRSNGALNILPERCPDGCIVVYVQFGKWNLDEVSLEDTKKLYVLLYLQLLRDPMVQINGLKTIYDWEGTNIRHIRLLTLQNLYLLYHIPLNCCPSRHKEVHVINQTSMLTMAWKLVNPFLSEKIRKRCHFHSDDRKLLEFFPASILPTKYGGDVSDIDSTELFRRLNKEQQNHPIQGQPNFY